MMTAPMAETEYSNPMGRLTLEWIRGGMKEAPVAIVERVSTVTHGGITNALEACRIGD